MGSFLLFILLILFLMVGIPLIRGFFYMQNLRRRVNESFRGRQQHERPSRERNEEEEYTETGERKIFTSNEGEYADFEEVSGTVSQEATTSTGDTRTVIEDQVTDAEYEEIP